MRSATSFARCLQLALLLAAAFARTEAWAADASASYPSDGGMAARLQPFLDDHAVAGAVVVVADKNRVLDLETIGYSNLPAGKAIQANDLFYIASMTKCFTAVSLMMMVDAGKIHLDDPVEKYLPEFKRQMVEEAENRGRPHLPQHPITIKEVMSHAAGIVGEAKPRRFNLAEEVQGMAQMRLHWEPGSKFDYSPGPEIGGRIVEVTSGIPYGQFVQERLLDPLGMKETSFWPDAALASRLVLTHEFNTKTNAMEPLKLNSDLLSHPEKCGTTPPIILSQFPASMIQSYAQHFARPSGGLFSTPLDITKFCQMLLGGGTYRGKQYISPAAFQQMTSIQTGDLLVGNGLEGYGIGCFVRRKAIAGEPSVGSFGHHGSRKTQMWIDPQNQIAMILMVQGAELDSKRLRALYSAYQKLAIARFGKAGERERPSGSSK